MASNNNDKHTGKNNNKHLFYLNELSDYKVASDDPDVRGWKVKDSDNRVIGKVDNLLVNKNTERVVYLDVEVDSSIIEANHDPYGQPADSDVHEFINKDGENHIIIPVGLVRINDKDNDNKYVYTDRINHRTFAETKRMEKGSNVSRDYEVVVLDSYNRDRDNDRNTGSLGRDDNNRTGTTGVAGGTTGVAGNTGTTRNDNDLGKDSGTRRTGDEGSITGASNRTGNNNLGSDATTKRTSDDNTLTGSSNRTGNDDLRGDSGSRRGGDDSLLTNSQRRGSDDFGRDTDSRSNNDLNRESARTVTDDRGNDTGRRVNDDLGRDSSTRDSDFNRDSNRVNTNTDSSLSGADSNRKNYDSLGDADRRSGDDSFRGDNDRNRHQDDDSFYERREFDRSNFRRNNSNNNNNS